MKTVKTRVIAAVSAMLVTVSAVSFPLAVFAEEAQQTAASASSKKYANATEISSLDDFQRTAHLTAIQEERPISSPAT